jgi:hypothetical protein
MVCAVVGLIFCGFMKTRYISVPAGTLTTMCCVVMRLIT